MIIELNESQKKVLSFNCVISKACIVLSIIACYFALIFSAFSVSYHTNYSNSVIAIVTLFILYTVWLFDIAIDNKAMNQGNIGLKRFLFIILSCIISSIVLLGYLYAFFSLQSGISIF